MSSGGNNQSPSEGEGDLGSWPVGLETRIPNVEMDRINAKACENWTGCKRAGIAIRQNCKALRKLRISKPPERRRNKQKNTTTPNKDIEDAARDPSLIKESKIMLCAKKSAGTDGWAPTRRGGSCP